MKKREEALAAKENEIKAKEEKLLDQSQNNNKKNDSKQETLESLGKKYALKNMTILPLIILHNSLWSGSRILIFSKNLFP